ncbi:MAG: MBL fold metallo-hydrolase [Prevotellaceae bacterium]|nr:MBL fold metallo-hydrolase [Prevotellaceae bacterium]
MKIKRFEWNMLGTNCYVLWDETQEAVVIDASCYYEEERNALKKFIDENKLIPKHLLNTHLHFDHIFGNAFVNRLYGLLPEAHEADEFWIRDTPQHSRLYSVKGKESPVPLGKHLHDGDLITFGQTMLEAIHVPGHSPGSLVYYNKEQGCLFAGDVLFQGSVGRADLAGGNFDELIDNICSRLFVLPDDTVVYPGHGGATTIGTEKAENPFFRYRT